MLSHTGIKEHKCKTCKKQFANTYYLERHMLSHTRIKEHQCKTCKKQFAHASHLKRHILSHTKSDFRTKSHDCDVCNKQFNDPSNLKQHLLTHSGIKPHECDICQKQFTLPVHLRRHMLTHTGIKQYQCTVCMKQFMHPHHVKRHMLTHSGTKTHQCKVCQKYFSLECNLKTHIMTHAKIKPHKCELCQKNFTQASNLKQHMLTHTGIKPHKCEVCPKQFTQIGSLRTHMLIHIGNIGMKPCKCNSCDKQFSHPSSLRRHTLTHSDGMCNTNKNLGEQNECSHCHEHFISNEKLQNHISENRISVKTPDCKTYMCGKDYGMPTEKYGPRCKNMDKYKQNEAREYKLLQCIENDISRENTVRKGASGRINKTMCPDGVNFEYIKIEPNQDSFDNANALGIRVNSDSHEKDLPDIKPPTIKFQTWNLDVTYEDQCKPNPACCSCEVKTGAFIVDSDEHGVKVEPCECYSNVDM